MFLSNTYYNTWSPKRNKREFYQKFDERILKNHEMNGLAVAEAMD